MIVGIKYQGTVPDDFILQLRGMAEFYMNAIYPIERAFAWLTLRPQPLPYTERYILNSYRGTPEYDRVNALVKLNDAILQPELALRVGTPEEAAAWKDANRGIASVAVMVRASYYQQMLTDIGEPIPEWVARSVARTEAAYASTPAEPASTPAHAPADTIAEESAPASAERTTSIDPTDIPLSGDVSGADGEGE